MTSYDDYNDHKDLVPYDHKDLVPYKGVPTVPPPPPPPKNFILKFNKLVESLDVQRKKFEALQFECEKRNYPVVELIDLEEFYSRPSLRLRVQTLSETAKSLLEELQSSWPDENLDHHTSRKCIGIRLDRMAKLLPKGEQADAKNLIEHVEAELPSVMALETTCREFEAGTKPFPLPGHISPVLRKQNAIWARRMEALDAERIEQIGIEWQEARQEQYAIFEEALRQRLAHEGYDGLLDILDADKRVDECEHFVSAIMGLFEVHCIELAEKLQQALKNYQRLSDEDDENYNDEAWSQAHDEVWQRYHEARQLIPRKKREVEERHHHYEYNQLRDERERWEEYVLDYDPFSEISKETIAEIEKNGFERVEQELVEHQDEEKHSGLLRELEDRLAMIPELLDRLRQQDKTIRELRDRLSYLEYR